MILQYTIENFYSFREPAVVDFTVPAQAGDRPGLLTSESGQRVNAVTAILGANASGKTNLLKPLAFLRWFLVNSARTTPEEQFQWEPFSFSTRPNDKPTRISLNFEFQGEEYLYKVSFNHKRVIQESLHRKKQRFSYVFEREWNPDSNQYDFKAQDLGYSASVPQRENASWLSCAFFQGHWFAKKLTPFFGSLHGNLGTSGRTTIHDSEWTNLVDAATYLEYNPDVLENVSSLIKNFDLGISGFEIRQIKTPSPTEQEFPIYYPVVFHSLGSDKFDRPLLNESRGTKSLFVLLRYLLPVLEEGGIAFIDEFESGLHPHMVKAVVDLFFNPATNPKQAQLIATFHTDYLLRDTLNKYQNYLVEKDETLNSVAYRLDSIRQAKGGKAPRNVDNLYDKYHAGAYGGIPDLM